MAVIIGTDNSDILVGTNDDDQIQGLGGNDLIFGGGGNDRIAGGNGDDTIDGGTGNDSIRGGNGHDIIYGGAGNDRIGGGDGDDRIFGGDGSDRIAGGLGNDTIEGNSGNDNINGGAGNDTLYGGEDGDRLGGGIGDDTIFGGAGDDYLDGGAGDDVLFGGDGNDIFYGGGNGGSNRLLGGAGDDLFYVFEVVAGGYVDGSIDTSPGSASSAFDIRTGDTINLQKFEEGVYIDLDRNTAGTLTPPNPVPGQPSGPGNESQIGELRLASEGFSGDYIDVIDVENIIGTQHNDILFGNNEGNVIIGGDGDDNIHPFGGTNYVDGGAGVDVLNLSAGVGYNIDFLTGIAGSNTFVNFENALGSFNGEDKIFGDNNDNVLNGQGQDDLLDGRGGNDTLTGGTNLDGTSTQDTFRFTGTSRDGLITSVTDFDEGAGGDIFALDASDFGVYNNSSIVAINAPLDVNFLSANLAGGGVFFNNINVVVVRDLDDDNNASTAYGVSEAAELIALSTNDSDGGFFVYFDSVSGVNQLASSNSFSAGEDAKIEIIAELTDTVAGNLAEAQAQLNAFLPENFDFVVV